MKCQNYVAQPTLFIIKGVLIENETFQWLYSNILTINNYTN